MHRMPRIPKNQICLQFTNKLDEEARNRPHFPFTFPTSFEVTVRLAFSLQEL